MLIQHWPDLNVGTISEGDKLDLNHMHICMFCVCACTVMLQLCSDCIFLVKGRKCCEERLFLPLLSSSLSISTCLWPAFLVSALIKFIFLSLSFGIFCISFIYFQLACFAIVPSIQLYSLLLVWSAMALNVDFCWPLTDRDDSVWPSSCLRSARHLFCIKSFLFSLISFTLFQWNIS